MCKLTETIECEYMVQHLPDNCQLPLSDRHVARRVTDMLRAPAHGRLHGRMHGRLKIVD